jgi:large subunit ribosomal protein L26e
MAGYRKKYVIHVERIQREKNNGANVYLGVHTSNCVITNLDMTKDRAERLKARKESREASEGKGKYSQSDVSMAGLD